MEYIDAVIPIVGGLALTWIAYNAETMGGKHQEWFQKHGRSAKVLGPVVALGGVVVLISKLM